MEKEAVLAIVQCVFREVFEREDLVITRASTADDIEEWTSLTHVMLVAAEEKKLGVKFKLREILQWKNVGDMVDCIAGKC